MSAGRKAKQTVDYFPHYTKHGKTLYILEQRWGDSGYSGLYKIMEVLADEEGHCYDARRTDKWEFLIAKVGSLAPEILQKLADLDVIDRDLWGVRVVWMQSFVESIKEVYRRRFLPLPIKPELSLFLPPEIKESPISSDVNSEPQEKKNKPKNPKPPLKADEEKTLHLRYVMLTPTESDSLKKRMGDVAQEYIERLDGYIGQIGVEKALAKYKSHYDTMLNWYRKDIKEGKIQPWQPPSGDNGSGEKKVSWNWDAKGFFKVEAGLRVRVDDSEVPENIRNKRKSVAAAPEHREGGPGKDLVSDLATSKELPKNAGERIRT